MAEIDHLDRNDAILLAKRMRNKVRNLEIDKKATMMGAARTATSGASAYVMGYIMGGLEAEYLKDQAAIDAEDGAEDPRKIAGIDKDGLVGAALVAGGLFGVAAAKGKGATAADFLLAAGDGVLSGYLHNMGMRAGLEAAAKDA
jgi:hypothetical protein